jgi:hypothetical protein
MTLARPDADLEIENSFYVFSIDLDQYYPCIESGQTRFMDSLLSFVGCYSNLFDHADTLINRMIIEYGDYAEETSQIDFYVSLDRRSPETNEILDVLDDQLDDYLFGVSVLEDDKSGQRHRHGLESYFTTLDDALRYVVRMHHRVLLDAVIETKQTVRILTISGDQIELAI